MKIEQTTVEVETLDLICGEMEGSFKRFLEKKSRLLCNGDAAAEVTASPTFSQETASAA